MDIWRTQKDSNPTCRLEVGCSIQLSYGSYDPEASRFCGSCQGHRCWNNPTSPKFQGPKRGGIDCCLLPFIWLTVDPSAHFAGIALQRGFRQFAARDLGDQGDHVLPDGLMLTSCGIAEADNLYYLFLLENNVLAAVSGGINPFGPKHQRGRLCTAGGEENKGDKAFHRASLAGFG